MIKQVYDIYKKESLSRESLDSITKQYDGLNSREKMLSSEIDKLKTDVGVEEEIRSKFDVEKPGEETVVIIDSSSSAETTSTTGGVGLWQNFINWFR
jgi:cell division protein FtsB